MADEYVCHGVPHWLERHTVFASFSIVDMTDRFNHSIRWASFGICRTVFCIRETERNDGKNTHTRTQTAAIVCHRMNNNLCRNQGAIYDDCVARNMVRNGNLHAV